jgi:hypothetical protein
MAGILTAMAAWDRFSSPSLTREWRWQLARLSGAATLEVNRLSLMVYLRV